MTDFANRILRPERDDHPVRSLDDVDFYKFTMLHFIWTYYRKLPVRYECINRKANIPVAQVVDEAELRRALDHVRTLSFSERTLSYLFGQQYYGKNMFPYEFIEALRNLRLPPYTLSTEGDQYVLAFEGEWFEVELWETIALAVVFELYARSLLRRMNTTELCVFYARATDRLYGKLMRLRDVPGLTFADFGQRRRHSFLWQWEAVRMAKEVMGSRFKGTSNTRMAAEHNLMPIGTNAHSLVMAVVAARFSSLMEAGKPEAIRALQYDILDQWAELYGPGVRILLPDTYGTVQFFAGADKALAHEWRGVRQDSGDPIEVGEAVLEWYRGAGVEKPKEAGKLLVFSDGLDVELMIELFERFKDDINVTFGWGTNFTNGFDGLHPTPDAQVPGLSGLLWGEVKWAFSMVCKIVAAGGNPAVKLPDNLAKATGPAAEQERYKEVFGRGGRDIQEVIV